ncbi:MAG: RNA polymerase sigma factor [Chloroflexi bacterium]|nr:MAG: RNA polymerase sigma factor [Chloroflexota bacterium]
MERTNAMWLEALQDDGPRQAEALADLRRFLKRGVLGYLRTRSDLGNLADAELDQMSEDFVQEALLKIQNNLHTFQGKSKFTTWATKIAANLTISELRRSKWRDLSLDALTEAGMSLQEILGGDSTQSPDPHTQSERQQVWAAIVDVLNNDLTERQRQVMAAVQIQHIPMAEVARLLDTNVNNIYKIMHDARLKLKNRLLALGFSTDYILNLFSRTPG